MGSIPDSLKNAVRHFQTDLQLLFGSHVVSLIVYGSAVTDDFIPRKSDINLLIVLDEEGIQDLRSAHKKIGQWQRRRIRPLFLTEEYIMRSLDSYPLEFLNMRLAYRVLEGKDVLESLQFDPGDLRLQCEREIKGKLLLLRQGFVQSRGDRSALRRLIAESMVTFAAIFRGLLFLTGQDVPQARADVIRQTCHRFDLDLDLFDRLLAVRLSKVRVSRDKLEENLVSYIAQIDSLSRQVDGMEM